MSIIGQESNSKLGLKGKKPDSTTSPESKLHNLSSVNNQPDLTKTKFKFQKNLVPSRLDMDGKTPKKYTDNLPK